MARLGHQGSNKETDHGKLYWGEKTLNFLKDKSRVVLEEYQDISLLYFQIDWMKSKKNFYGELLFKKFVNPLGIQIKGAIKMSQGEEQLNQGVPNKIMKLAFSCYTEQLKELNIEPNYGDYFAYGQRLYQIYDRTLKDYGPGNVNGNRERMRIDYLCIQEDDETIQRDPWGDNLGLDIQIRGNGSIENL